MPKIKRTPKIPSAKERIEATRRIATHEMAWHRSRKGELKPASTLRTTETVSIKPPRKKDYSEIHTHTGELVQGEKIIVGEGRSLPSTSDISMIIRDIKLSNIRTWHIATINENGKVTGYVSLHATSKFLKFAKTSTLKDVNNRFKLSINSPHGKEAVHKVGLLEKMQKRGLNVHITPMFGYVFIDGMFLKDTIRKAAKK